MLHVALTHSYNKLIRNRKPHTKTKDPHNHNTHDNKGWGGGRLPELEAPKWISYSHIADVDAASLMHVR